MFSFATNCQQKISMMTKLFVRFSPRLVNVYRKEKSRVTFVWFIARCHWKRNRRSNGNNAENNPGKSFTTLYTTRSNFLCLKCNHSNYLELLILVKWRMQVVTSSHHVKEERKEEQVEREIWGWRALFARSRDKALNSSITAHVDNSIAYDSRAFQAFQRHSLSSNSLCLSKPRSSHMCIMDYALAFFYYEIVSWITDFLVIKNSNRQLSLLLQDEQQFSTPKNTS